VLTTKGIDDMSLKVCFHYSGRSDSDIFPDTLCLVVQHQIICFVWSLWSKLLSYRYFFGLLLSFCIALEDLR
jgi:hypothetical protein